MRDMFSSVVSSSLSPNTEFDDVWEAFRVMCTPWTWKKGPATLSVQRWFTTRYPGAYAVTFNSARAALMTLLTALGIGRGDEVLLQAFTCVAVPNSVLWAGATPVYVDIDSSFNIDVADLEKKYTARSRAIIVQHTFGFAANMDAIVAFAKKHKLLLIEDCAHSLGATYKGKPVGSFGDAAIFSFGRDKILSSVWGGMAIVHERCPIPTAASALRQYHQTLQMPSYGWIAQQLFHPIAFSLILPLYNSGLGKLLLIVLQKLRLLSFPVSKEEIQSVQPKHFAFLYANGLAQLLLIQLKKLDRYTQTRKTRASYYTKELTSRGIYVGPFSAGSSYLRFPVLVDKPDDLRAKVKRDGILLGNWYGNVIDPKLVDMKRIGYIRGSCPNAENAATHIINLPTRVPQAQAERIVALF